MVASYNVHYSPQFFPIKEIRKSLVKFPAVAVDDEKTIEDLIELWEALYSNLLNNREELSGSEPLTLARETVELVQELLSRVSLDNSKAALASYERIYASEKQLDFLMKNVSPEVELLSVIVDRLVTFIVKGYTLNTAVAQNLLDLNFEYLSKELSKSTYDELLTLITNALESCDQGYDVIKEMWRKVAELEALKLLSEGGQDESSV